MTQIPDEMYQAHTILERYVEIHDKIFKFSWRKAIPIPGLFKPIDYGQHLRELDSLASELKRLVISISSRTEVPDVFHKFIAASLKQSSFFGTCAGGFTTRARAIYEVTQ